MKAKMAERGQVTIPKALRERLGIRPVTILEFKEDRGKLVAIKAVAMNTVDRLYGTRGSGRRTDDIMQEIRAVCDNGNRYQHTHRFKVKFSCFPIQSDSGRRLGNVRKSPAIAGIQKRN